jgi:myb proto-oncogene protein
MARIGTCTADEDSKLKDSVQMHGGKDWTSIATLIPGRTNSQCHDRWRKALNPSIARSNGSTGIWTEEEDIKL